MEKLDFQAFGGIHIAGNAFGSTDDPPVLLLPPSGQTKEFWFGSAAALANAGIGVTAFRLLKSACSSRALNCSRNRSRNSSPPRYVNRHFSQSDMQER